MKKLLLLVLWVLSLEAAFAFDEETIYKDELFQWTTNGVTYVKRDKSWHISRFEKDALRVTLPREVVLADTYIRRVTPEEVIHEYGYNTYKMQDIIDDSTPDINKTKELVFESGITAVSAKFSDIEGSLTKVELPEGVHTITSHAFAGCNNLKEINWPKSLETISTNAFKGASITNVDFSKTKLRFVGIGAFENCKKVKDDLIFPPTLEKIETGAFYGLGEELVDDDDSMPHPSAWGNFYNKVVFTGRPPQVDRYAFASSVEGDNKYHHRYRLLEYRPQFSSGYYKAEWKTAIESWMKANSGYEKYHGRLNFYDLWICEPPRIESIKPAKLWLTEDGPYNLKIECNKNFDTNLVETALIKLELKGKTSHTAKKVEIEREKHICFEEKDGKFISCFDMAYDLGNNLCRQFPVFKDGEHGEYEAEMTLKCRDTTFGVEWEVPVTCEIEPFKVFFHKFEKDDGKFANWYRYWIRDEAITPPVGQYDVNGEGMNLALNTTTTHPADCPQDGGFEGFYYKPYENDSKAAFEGIDEGTKIETIRILPFNIKKYPIIYKLFKPHHKFVGDGAAGIGGQYSSNIGVVGGRGDGKLYKGLEQFAADLIHETRHQTIAKLYCSNYRLIYDASASDEFKSNDIADVLRRYCFEWMDKWGNDAINFMEDPYIAKLMEMCASGKYAWDRDGDGVRDEDETRGVFGNISNPLNSDSAQIDDKFYRKSGYADNEILARLSEKQFESNIDAMIHKDKDFAFPGNNVATNCQKYCHVPVYNVHEQVTHVPWDDVRNKEEEKWQNIYEDDSETVEQSSDRLLATARRLAFANVANPSNHLRIHGSLECVEPFDDYNENCSASIDTIEAMPVTYNSIGLIDEIPFVVKLSNTASLGASVRGVLVDANNKAVASATTILLIPEGGCEVELVFHAEDISPMSTPGYKLATVEIVETMSDFPCKLGKNCSVEMLEQVKIAELAKPKIQFNAVDIKDVLEGDNLVMTLPITVNLLGDYRVLARISTQDIMDVANAEFDLCATEAGEYEIKLVFAAEDIRRFDIYDNFILSALTFSDSEGMVAHLDEIVTTAAYDFTKEDEDSGEGESGESGVINTIRAEKVTTQDYLDKLNMLIFMVDFDYTGTELLTCTMEATIRGASGEVALVKKETAYLMIQNRTCALMLNAADFADCGVVGPYTLDIADVRLLGNLPVNPAKPTSIEYTILFEANGGVGAKVEQPMKSGKAKALCPNRFVREGFVFKGWATDKTATNAVYANREKVVDLAAKDGAKVTLYAVWEKDTAYKLPNLQDYYGPYALGREIEPIDFSFADGWKVAGLPTGLKLDAKKGVVTGKPTKSGMYTVALTRASDKFTVTTSFEIMSVARDKSAIMLFVDRTLLLGEEECFDPVTLPVGVNVNWKVLSGALTATTIKVAGLPSGLKLVQDKVTKAYSIQGTPTAASKVDKKTGNIVPSLAKFTVTTAGKNSRVFTMPITTEAMPAWAVGTFNGGLISAEGKELGLVTLTTTAAGKISGKILKRGQTWAVSATGFDAYDVDGYHATLTAKSGKLTPETYEIVIDKEGVFGANADGEQIEAYWNPWKTSQGKARGKDLAAMYKPGLPTEGLELPEGMTSLTLKLSASGAINATGFFDGGYKATSSTVLVSTDSGYLVYLYFAPNAKKGFVAGEAFTVRLDL